MDYWKIRASKYNQLQWVRDKTLLQQLIDFSELQLLDIVLDAGCGTGIVAKEIVDKVLKIVAMDTSKDMLNQLPTHNQIVPICADIETYCKGYGMFDKIIARMVFHHIPNLITTFKNCYNLLNEGGWLIIQEGGVIPKHEKEVYDWYCKMISLKESRNNFTTEDLRTYFLKTGFKKIVETIVIDKKFSINNWLENSGQDVDIINQIYDLHYNAPEKVKKYYNMRIKDKKITIDSKVLLIKGQK